MRIVDLGEQYHEDYFKCLEEYSEDMQDAGVEKMRWYEEMKDRGLGVKLALDDHGQAGGMIQYVPIEHSYAEGEDLYTILCIWVHPHKQGRGNYRKRGMGAALLAAAEEDARSRGAKGMVAWGLILPSWMRASWFKRHGYVPVDRNGIALMLWKPFSSDATPPRWIRERKKPLPLAGRVTVTAMVSGWCPAQNIICERARRACGEFGEEVVFEQIDTRVQATRLEWGILDSVFVDGRKLGWGPPVPYAKVRKTIARRVGKMRRSLASDPPSMAG